MEQIVIILYPAFKPLSLYEESFPYLQYLQNFAPHNKTDYKKPTSCNKSKIKDKDLRFVLELTLPLNVHYQCTKFY